MTASRSERTVALAAGLLLAVCFTGWAAFAIAGWSIGSVTRNYHRELPFSVAQLNLAAGSGDVTVLPGGDRVTIDSHLRGSFHAPRASVQVRGDTVDVKGGCSGIEFGHCESDFVVHVPAGTALRIGASSGDVSVTGLDAPVSVRASSGDVALNDLSAGADVNVSSGDVDANGIAGDVSIDSASGDVSVADMRGGELQARANSGDIDVEYSRVPRSVDLVAESGDVALGVPRGTYNVDAESGNGERDVTVQSDPRSRRMLHARSDSGDVSIGYARQ